MKGPQTDTLTEENLRRVYVDNADATLESAGVELGCSRDTVRRWLRRYGLPVKDKGREGVPKKEHNRLLADRGWLEEQLKTKTAREIAQELGSKDAAVSYWVYKHGLRDRTFDGRAAAIKEALAKKYPNGRSGELAANWQGGRVPFDGYIKVYAPNHPYADNLGYVFEHRLVAEEHIGRYLEPDEVVHHLNGNRQDNRWENLEVKLRGQHLSDHFKAGHEVVALREENEDLYHEIETLQHDKEILYDCIAALITVVKDPALRDKLMAIPGFPEQLKKLAA